MITLRGITWNHERGLGPLLATADAYTRQNPQVQISWDVRTLQDFADYPIEQLAQRFDMIIIDHPFVGFAADDGCLLPLDRYLDAAVLADQAANSVGQSHASYAYGGHQWALAVDAAGHVSVYRPDLLAVLEATVPETWDELLAWADRLRRAGRGQIALPLIPVDSAMSFLSICANTGEAPGASEERFVSRATGRYALDLLRQLRSLSHPGALTWNPPALLEQMSGGDEVLYCPLLFGYSNYARPGWRPKQVRFTNIPSAGHGPRGGILGGTGLAIASRCTHPVEASRYAAFVAAGEVQRTLYFRGGGQPGHRAAWTDDATNAAASTFFRDTLATLDQSYLRPRYNGYMQLQDELGLLIHAFLRDGGDREALLDDIDRRYRVSRTPDATT